MAFWLSGMEVVLHLDNSNAKAYLCNQGWYSIYFSFQTSMPHFESGHMHGIVFFLHTCLYMSMWKPTITEEVGSRVAPSPLHS